MRFIWSRLFGIYGILTWLPYVAFLCGFLVCEVPACPETGSTDMIIIILISQTRTQRLREIK